MENVEDFMHDGENKKDSKSKRRQLGLSCMLNTEVGAVLAVIRRPECIPLYNIPSSEDNYDSSIVHSLRSLRSLIFNPQQEWRTIDPSIYLSPFLDVIQSDDVPAIATGIALSSLLKILKFEVFDEKSPGAREAMESIVSGLTSCRLEKTDGASEDAVMMKILQVLTGIMHHKASPLLTDQSVCTLVNTCFQVHWDSTVLVFVMVHVEKLLGYIKLLSLYRLNQFSEDVLNIINIFLWINFFLHIYHIVIDWVYN